MSSVAVSIKSVIQEQTLLVIKTIRIDGEWFVLTVPTIEQWIHFLEWLEKNPEEKAVWNKRFGKMPVSKIYCQRMDDGKMKLVQVDINSYDKESSEVEFKDSYKDISYLDVGFLPVLMPLDATGEYLDFSSVRADTEYSFTTGGSFYLNTFPVASAPNAVLHLLPPNDYEEMDVLDIDDSHEDITEKDYLLRWLQVDHAYLCKSVLLVGWAFQDIIKHFNYDLDGISGSLDFY